MPVFPSVMPRLEHAGFRLQVESAICPQPIETVNSTRLPIRAGQIAGPDGSAIEVRTNASTLPTNRRRRLAMRIHSGNSAAIVPHVEVRLPGQHYDG